MTLNQARELGWTLSRGAYVGATNDRADRWYWDHEDNDCLDRRGPGYRTQRDALNDLSRRIAANLA